MNERARTLRRNLTDAERRLWWHLRARQLCGCKFRRQHPVAGYIADFACPDRRLIIEVDGGHHNDQRTCDAARTNALETAGYRVLRFWNHEVLTETAAVLEAIRRALPDDGGRGSAAAPSSRPSPPEGEKEQSRPGHSEGAEGTPAP